MSGRVSEKLKPIVEGVRKLELVNVLPPATVGVALTRLFTTQYASPESHLAALAAIPALIATSLILNPVKRNKRR